jgi:hypothetical protein
LVETFYDAVGLGRIVDVQVTDGPDVLKVNSEFTV